jgi:hypothetical protein
MAVSAIETEIFSAAHTDSVQTAEKCTLETDPILAAKWERVASFVIDDPSAEQPFSFILRQEMEWDSEFTELAISEYRKFMLLCSLYPHSMTPSVHVDTVWHLHLLYTRNYHKFCLETLDCNFLHHDPSKGGPVEDQIFTDFYAITLAKYVEIFGTIPPDPIWGSRV